MAGQVFEVIFICFFGLILGSFATALSWRVPRGVPWFLAARNHEGQFARSACNNCKKTLTVLDLIPLFSWIGLRGRCRHCGQPIGLRYPLIELATLLGCVGVYLVWGFTGPAFIIMALVPLLVALWVIDGEHMILPDQLVIFSLVLGFLSIIYQWSSGNFGYDPGGQALSKLAGMVAFAVTVWLAGKAVSFLLKKDALGFGDVKFFAMAGLWLGLPYLPYFLVSAGLFGVVTGLYYRFILKKQPFPFGPALIAALYTGLLLQGLEIVPLIGVQ